MKQCLIKVEIEHAFSIIINYNVHAEQSSVARFALKHTDRRINRDVVKRTIHSLAHSHILPDLRKLFSHVEWAPALPPAQCVMFIHMCLAAGD